MGGEVEKPVEGRPVGRAAQINPKGRTLTVTGSGDILIHPSLAAQAESVGTPEQPNFGPMLAGIRGRIASADYSICHVETPFSQPGVKTEYPHYYVHPNLAKAIKATGFDECSTASNWTYDKGMAGIERTIDSLKAVGVRQAGSLRSAKDQRIKINTVKGIKVAHLSYTDPSDSPTVAGSEWAVNRQSPSEIAQDARTARQRGAQIVIVSYAAGAMESTQVSASQQAAVRTMTAAGDVDFVIGHGSHTVQPAEKINGTWVVWHGNLLASFFPDQTTMLTGLISQATFQETKKKGRFALTKLTGIPVQSVNGSIRAMDLVAHKCEEAKQYESGWKLVQATQQPAIAQGMKLPAICAETNP